MEYCYNFVFEYCDIISKKHFHCEGVFNVVERLNELIIFSV